MADSNDCIEAEPSPISKEGELKEGQVKEENNLLVTAPKDPHQANLINEVKEMLSHYNRAVKALETANSIQVAQYNESQQEILKKSDALSATSAGRIFSHFYHMCLDHGANRDLFHKFIFAIIPNLSYAQRTSFMDALWEKSSLKKKRRACLHGYINQRSILAAKSRDLIFKKIETDLARRERALKAEQRFKERSALQEELNEKRREFAKILEERNQKKREEEEVLKELKEQEEKKYQKHVKVVQELAKEFSEEKEKNKRAEAEQKKQTELEEKQKMRRYVQVNKPKIVKRNEQAVKKVTYLATVKSKREEEQKKEIERIKEAVENYPSRPKPERNAFRLRQDTEALSLKKQTNLDKADKVVLFRNDGFTVDGLMKDVRYKIGAALAVKKALNLFIDFICFGDQEAGLNNTPYANQLLAALSYN